ncbi:MAG: tetratricopeptide repeat protein, partial [Deltaproteobacteria bacterium]|nr:tetratricopeptide repeat protein [Deltaproteobacteria bacterium]
RVEFRGPCPVCGLRNPEGRVSCVGCGTYIVDPESDRTIASSRRPEPSDFSGAGDETLPAEPPFVGRAEELRTLISAVERSLEREHATLVVVTGAGGSGKTRLVTEVLGRLGAGERRVGAGHGRAFRILTAAVREGADGPFAPFSRLLLERFGVTPASGPTAVRGMMTTEVGRLLGGRDAALVAEVTHLLGHIAGVPFPDSPVLRALEGDPGQIASRTRMALRTFLAADARSGGPIVIFVDKMNLATPQGLGLLGDLVAPTTRAAVCLIVAGRPPVAQMLEGLVDAADSNACVVRLQPFTEAQAGEYLQALLPQIPRVPEELVGAAWHRSEGNAASLREMARMFLDAGVIDTSATPWTVDLERLSDGSLPVTLEDAHRARIARLDAEERQAMERASVFGEVFWQEALLALARAEHVAGGTTTSWDDDIDARDLHDLCRRLEAAGFISPVEEGRFPHTIEYAFRHAGIREVLYRDLAQERRRAYHLRAAQWLENASGPRREEYLVAIGEHYEQGGEPRKAAFSYLFAAGQARASFHNEQAIVLYERGLRLVAQEDGNARVEAHHDLGSVHYLVGDYDEALAQFTAMLDVAWALCHRGKGGAALNRMARVHRARGRICLARRCLERALVLFRSVEDTRGIASTLDDLGSLAALEGDYEMALGRSAEALELRRSLSDRRGTAVSLHTIGTIETARGLFREAEACFDEALQIRREIDDLEGVAVTLNALGVVATERGEHERALVPWQEALETARALGYRRIVATILNNMGEAELLSLNLESATTLLTEAALIADEIEDKRVVTEVRRNLGRVHMKQNDLAKARVELERSLDVAEELGTKQAIGVSLLALAELHSLTLFDEGQAGGESGTEHPFARAGAGPDMAEGLYRRALGIFEEIRNENEMAKCLSSYGYYLLERGDTDSGREALERAAAIFRKMESRSGEKIQQTIQEL